MVLIIFSHLLEHLTCSYRQKFSECLFHGNPSFFAKPTSFLFHSQQQIFPQVNLIEEGIVSVAYRM